MDGALKNTWTIAHLKPLYWKLFMHLLLLPQACLCALRCFLMAHTQALASSLAAILSTLVGAMALDIHYRVVALARLPLSDVI